jgi:glycosyltransferase involved in cell wall biosynthesis
VVRVLDPTDASNLSAPFLSICIPSYNAGAWVRGAIDSALAQVPPEIVEVIVVDNASTDDSRKVLEPYVGTDRLQVVFAQEHLSMAENWNRAVRLSRGEWCLLLCADDELLPGFVENFLQHADDPDTIMVGQACHWCEGDPPRIVRTLGLTQRIYQGNEGVRRFAAGTPFVLQATAFRRSAFETVGGFTLKAEGVGSPWDFCMRLAALEGGRSVVTGHVGARYHTDRGNTWTGMEEDGSDIAFLGRWQTRIRPDLERFGIAAEARKNLARRGVRAAIRHERRGNDGPANDQLAASIRYGAGAWRLRAVFEWTLLRGGGKSIAKWRSARAPEGQIPRRAAL